MQFWSAINPQATLTSATTGSIQYMRFIGGQLTVATTTTMNNFEDVHHNWIEHITGVEAFNFAGGTAVVNAVYSNCLVRRSSTADFGFGSNTNGSQAYYRCWMEDSFGGIEWSTGPSTQTIKECVIKDLQSAPITVAATSSGKVYTIQDSYSYGQLVLHFTNAAHVGTLRSWRNHVRGAGIASVSTAGAGSFSSAFNDIANYYQRKSSVQAFAFSGGSTLSGGRTSDNDYITGQNLAFDDNIETSTATTSASSPSQYSGLSASRTNVKLVRNRPLTLDNVSTSSLDHDSVTINYDCTNGAVSGSGSTTINGDSASGGTTLNVASSTGFQVGETIEVGYGTARFEECVVSATGAGTITTTGVLAFTHTAADADTVKKQLRHIAIPYVRYGTSSGVYTMQSARAPREDLGLIFTGIRTTYNGKSYAFNRYSHSVPLDGLSPSTTYYYKVYADTPTSEILEAASEGTFTTSASPYYTDPGVGDVRSGDTYQFNSLTPNRTGTLVLPSENDVEDGVGFGTGGTEFTGNFESPSEDDVRDGTQYGANGTEFEGNAEFPSEDDVRDGTQYGTDGIEFEGNLVLPAIGDVRDTIQYGANGTEFTGTFGDGTPPTFAGIVSLVANSDGSITSSWLAATDPSTPIRYNVYIQAATATGLFSTTPITTTSLSMRLYSLPTGSPLSNGVVYYVGVRAFDNNGNTETNTTSLSATSSGVSSGEQYLAHGAFSINSSNNLQGTFWASVNGNRTLTGLGDAEYEIFDATGASTGITESGISADANGLYIITPTSAATLLDLTHYIVKITIDVDSEDRAVYKVITLGE